MNISTKHATGTLSLTLREMSFYCYSAVSQNFDLLIVLTNATIGAAAVRRKLEENIEKDKVKGVKHPGVKQSPGKSLPTKVEICRLICFVGSSAAVSQARAQSKSASNGKTDKVEEQSVEGKTKPVTDFLSNLKNGGDQGAKFFEQYKKKESNKYKPTYGM